MSTQPDKSKGAPDKSKDADAQHESDLLDEGLEESFPASDPPAVTTPGHADPKGPADDNAKKRR